MLVLLRTVYVIT